MRARKLLDEAARYGARFSLECGKVRIEAPAPLPIELLTQLRAAKSEIEDELTQPNIAKARAHVREALADFDRRLADVPRRNEEARRSGSTDRWCERCGDYASLAWPTGDHGREVWLCLACPPIAGCS